MNSGTASVPVEHFDAYVRRRSLSAVALSDGEAITAAVGLLRGCRDAGDDATTVRWWLTADGRPTLLRDEGGTDPMTATAESLLAVNDLVGAPATRALVDAARNSVLARRVELSEAIELRLFHHAQPRPLVLGPLSPVTEPAPITVPERGRGGGILALVDADLADGIRSAARDLRDRLRSSRPLRLAASGVGGAAVMIVAVLAFTAPKGGSPADSATVSSGSVIEPTASTPSVDPGAPLPDDVVEAARALLVRASPCDIGEGCPSDVWEGGQPTGDPLIPVDDATVIELVDDFGGVTVVRAADGTTGQYITLVSRNDRWLVRAVTTITDQPS